MIKLEQELLKIAKELLDCWLDDAYSNMDILGSYIDILHLIYKLPQGTDERDLALASIMTNMEIKYRIPLLGINIQNWLQKDYRNNIVLNIYERISNLRSI